MMAGQKCIKKGEKVSKRRTYNRRVENSPEISTEHVENSHVYVGNSPEHMENFPDHIENSYVYVENFHDHVENSFIHVENSLDLFGDPFGLEKLILELEKKRTNVEQTASGSDPLFPSRFTPWNSNQSRNEVVENVAHEGISSLGTVKSVPKNMSPSGSKHNHVDSLAPSPKLINGRAGWKGEKTMVTAFWGNMLFDFVTSSACGRSGGKWLATDSELLFMSVYSPQDMPHKRQLWAYMMGIINRWHGEVIVMGDFNEVCFASEQHGFTFYASNAAKFNTFITNSH
ncbi:RNA-directed DNA polymerase, eukaryota [Tanacetum coccineum]